jgi:hypothetical protein
MITPGDLTLEADYFRGRLRRHNRLLHGWGVVCGALVCRAPGKPGEGPLADKVVVGPGYILGPYGDEIVIAEPKVIDLHAAPGSPNGDDMDDPWCAPVQKPRTVRRYVAVKYKEKPARPVRVTPMGCGCEDTPCEHSRWRDDYEIGLLDHCPPSHEGPAPDFDKLLHPERLPVCPPCPEDPWVVLARVDLDKEGAVKNIDNYSCRRVVLSLAPFWLRISPQTHTISSSSIEIKGTTATVVDEDELQPGKTYEFTIEITGDIDESVMLDLGEGVTIEDVSVTDQTLTFKATIAPDAEPGPRTLTVTYPDCTQATLEKLVEITSTTT